MVQFDFQDLVQDLVTNRPNRHHHQDQSQRFHLYVVDDLNIKNVGFRNKLRYDFLFICLKELPSFQSNYEMF
jgi:hypothetical protein